MLIRLAAALFAAAVVGANSQPSAPRPNVVLIITDDVGYGDIGSYGAADVKTPNIDRLARNGVRFTDFYSNGSTCTPTRAGLISGRYQSRYAMDRPLGVGPDLELGLPPLPYSLPKLLSNNGYTTALIGKWHLGFKPENSPLAHGFGSFWGYKSGYVDYYHHTRSDGEADLFENDQPTKADGYLTDLITKRSVDFITRNAKQPFFLDVSYSAAHWPYQVPDRPSKAIDNSRHVVAYDANPETRADYVKMMERADQGVGEIVAAIERHGLARNTLVIFTNDNGGEWLSRNAPLFNHKFTLWEGGIRVPAIVSWPGRIPAGRVTPQVGITMDLTATILAATGTAVPADARPEGINLMPMLDGTAPIAERTLFWRVRTAGLDQRAVRSGNWKLIEEGTARLMLFDLSKDIGERNDLSATRTDVVRRLRQQAVAWQKDVESEAKARAGSK
ncbi:MAG TPA: sulfatase-like hydrolase/transferase [Vicinamibacterales bacterium]|nr:sulfatase-like hydrolase/transferase [Vicinamibacterales bacterium]